MHPQKKIKLNEPIIDLRIARTYHQGVEAVEMTGVVLWAQKQRKGNEKQKTSDDSREKR